jgi:hypothetical protein
VDVNTVKRISHQGVLNNDPVGFYVDTGVVLTEVAPGVFEYKPIDRYTVGSNS